MSKYLSTEAVRRWRAANPERAKEQNRRTYERHRETIIARSAQWQKDNPERSAEIKRKAALTWHHKNREASLAKARRWRQANPETVNHYNHLRRARKASAQGTHTVADLRARFEVNENRCVYCGGTEKLGPDHMIPLSRGGSNWPANIVPACLRCNQLKHTRTFFEFLEVA